MSLGAWFEVEGKFRSIWFYAWDTGWKFHRVLSSYTAHLYDDRLKWKMNIFRAGCITVCSDKNLSRSDRCHGIIDTGAWRKNSERAEQNGKSSKIAMNVLNFAV